MAGPFSVWNLSPAFGQSGGWSGMKWALGRDGCRCRHWGEPVCRSALSAVWFPRVAYGWLKVAGSGERRRVWLLKVAYGWLKVAEALYVYTEDLWWLKVVDVGGWE